MKNFIFKSTNADLQKMFQYIETKLDILAKNVLYSTNQLDFIRKKIMELTLDKGLQKQVDDYFDENHDQYDHDEQPSPPSTLGTSPQTDLDEQ